MISSFQAGQASMTSTVQSFKTKGNLGRGDEMLEAAFYPSFCMLRVHDRLFQVEPTHYTFGEAVWNSLTGRKNHVDLAPLTSHSYFYIAFTVPDCLYVTRYFVEVLDPAHHGIPLVFYLRRIQRAVLRFVRARRRMAVLMALHARLGRSSLLSCLPDDLLMKGVLILGVN